MTTDYRSVVKIVKDFEHLTDESKLQNINTIRQNPILFCIKQIITSSQHIQFWLARLGKIYERPSDDEKMKKCYELSIQYGNNSAISLIAKYYSRINDVSNMNKYIWYGIDKFDVDTLVFAGDNYESAKQYDKMEQYYLTALKNNSGHAFDKLCMYYAKTTNVSKFIMMYSYITKLTILKKFYKILTIIIDNPKINLEWIYKDQPRIALIKLVSLSEQDTIITHIKNWMKTYDDNFDVITKKNKLVIELIDEEFEDEPKKKKIRYFECDHLQSENSKS